MRERELPRQGSADIVSETLSYSLGLALPALSHALSPALGSHSIAVSQGRVEVVAVVGVAAPLSSAPAC